MMAIDDPKIYKILYITILNKEKLEILLNINRLWISFKKISKGKQKKKKLISI